MITFLSMILFLVIVAFLIWYMYLLFKPQNKVEEKKPAGITMKTIPAGKTEAELAYETYRLLENAYKDFPEKYEEYMSKDTPLEVRYQHMVFFTNAGYIIPWIPELEPTIEQHLENTWNLHHDIEVLDHGSGTFGGFCNDDDIPPMEEPYSPEEENNPTTPSVPVEDAKKEEKPKEEEKPQKAKMEPRRDSSEVAPAESPATTRPHSPSKLHTDIRKAREEAVLAMRQIDDLTKNS